MPYSAEHRTETKKNIIDSARKLFNRQLERSLTDTKRPRRETAQAIAALSIGGMVVARTLVDRAHAAELRASCIAAALELGGWEKTKNSNGTKPKIPRIRSTRQKS
jgi:hypothetical protein